MRIPLLVFVFAFAFGCAVGTVSARQLAVKNTSFEEPISSDSVKGWSVAGGGKVEKIEIDGKSWQTLPMDGSSRVFLAETGETVLNQLTPNFIRAGYTYTLSVDIGKSVGGTASDISKGISMAIYADMDGKTTQVAANTIKASDIGRNHLKF